MSNYSCGYFSPYDAVADVIEDEMFRTPRCESASLRLWVLVSWTIVEVIITLFAAAQTIQTILFSSKWSIRKTALTLSTCGAITRLILFMLAIFWIPSSVAYQLFLALPLCLHIAGDTAIIVQWLVVFLSLQRQVLKFDSETSNKIKKIWGIFNIINSAVLLFLWTLPVLWRTSNDPDDILKYNLLMALGFLWLGLTSFFLGISMLFVGNRLKQLIALAEAEANHFGSTGKTPDKGMKTAMDKLDLFSRTVFMSSVSCGGGCVVVFIWWASTINTAQGMSYFFFLLFFMFMPFELGSHAFICYMMRRASAQKQGSGIKVNSSSNPTSNNVASSNNQEQASKNAAPEFSSNDPQEVQDDMEAGEV